MMLATRKRVEALEAMAPARRRGGGLDREFAAMDQDERDAVRAFLVHWKNGGHPGDQEHDRLRRIAADAVFAARGRL
jgi:hypothetical protein